MFGFFLFMQCASSYFLSLHFLYSSRFVTPPTGSSSRYMGQQNSPVPSPYTPQSPATGYIQQYPHQQPPSYNQHQQIQQGENLCLMLMRMHGDSELIINFFSNVKLATKSFCLILSAISVALASGNSVPFGLNNKQGFD